jgi:hypothetical protein
VVTGHASAHESRQLNCHNSFIMIKKDKKKSPLPQHSRARPVPLPAASRSTRLRSGNHGCQRGSHGGAQARVPRLPGPRCKFPTASAVPYPPPICWVLGSKLLLCLRRSGRGCTCRPSVTWSRTSAAVSSSAWTTSATTTSTSRASSRLRCLLSLPGYSPLISRAWLLVSSLVTRSAIAYAG